MGLEEHALLGHVHNFPIQNLRYEETIRTKEQQGPFLRVIWQSPMWTPLF